LPQLYGAFQPLFSWSRKFAAIPTAIIYSYFCIEVLQAIEQSNLLGHARNRLRRIMHRRDSNRYLSGE
jgi:hypothetical protein